MFKLKIEFIFYFKVPNIRNTQS